MNHEYYGAEWLRRQLEADNNRAPRVRKDGQPFKNAKPFKAKTLSPLGAEVAEILGYVWRGLYHIRQGVLDRVDWSRTDYIEIVLSGCLATYDSCELAELVVLAHDRRMRLEIGAAARGYLRLFFSPRTTREGSVFTSHPTIETTIERIRKQVGEEVL